MNTADRNGNSNRESSHTALLAALCVVRKLESAQTVFRRRTARHRRALEQFTTAGLAL